MKILKFLSFVFLGLIFAFTYNCKKEKPKVIPILETAIVTNITSTSFTSGGEISSDGGAAVTSRGVCWNTAQFPKISDNKVINGTGTGSFTSSITGLSPGTTYYIRAFAINSVGTAYGNQVTATTTAILLMVSTSEVSAVSPTTVTIGGNISFDGGAAITARGVCWSTNQNPTISDSKTLNGEGTGSYTSSLTVLTPGTTYYIRAYATNSVGTAYGNQIIATTTALLSTLSTTAVSGLTTTGVTSGGNITFNGGAAVTARGICWSTTQNPTIANNVTSDGTGSGTYTSTITGLNPAVTYYLRAYATNSVGTSYGNEVFFTTFGKVPTVSIRPVIRISTSGATLSGTVNANYLSTTVSFEFGLTTSYGNSAIASQSPVTGNNYTNVNAEIAGLTESTAYHYRVIATNSLGTSISNDSTFNTAPTTVVDIDGNVYNVFVIGSQVWVKENLKATKYNDGTQITNVTDNSIWANLTSEAYCWYNNDASTYKNTYGALYNWYAVNTKKLCPVGWHVPTEVDWTILVNFLGGPDIAGDKLKESGTNHWISPNGGTNESRFTALPGGGRYFDGPFFNLGKGGYWWSNNGNNSYGTHYYIFSSQSIIGKADTSAKTNGLSVRCLMDN